MNKKDFDEIGQRLYDLEADPPREGWEKISSLMRKEARRARVISMLRRDWWKPLVLLIPFFGWWMSANKSVTPEMLSPSTVETITRQSSVDKTQPEISSATALVQKTEHHHVPGENQQALRGDADRIIDDGASQHVVPSVNDTGNANAELLFVEDAKNSPSTHVARDLEPVVDEPNKLEAESLVDLSKKFEVTDSTVQKEDKNENKKTWRVTLAFTPQYVSRSLKPVVNDDVFITKIDDRHTTPFQRVGLAFAAGAGRSLSEQWHVDAQLTYAQTGQQIYYSWSNGTVDTLMAMRQPDQTIKVKPVFEEYIGETRSRYTYAGARIGTTYYFWPTEQRRFSFSTFVGFNYLLSAKVEERTSEGWEQLAKADLNKMNYSLFAAVGYNIKLNHGWELVVSPSIHYNMRQVNSGALPYSVSQRSTGVMFMLAKTL